MPFQRPKPFATRICVPDPGNRSRGDHRQGRTDWNRSPRPQRFSDDAYRDAAASRTDHVDQHTAPAPMPRQQTSVEHGGGAVTAPSSSRIVINHAVRPEQMTDDAVRDELERVRQALASAQAHPQLPGSPAYRSYREFCAHAAHRERVLRDYMHRRAATVSQPPAVSEPDKNTQVQVGPEDITNLIG